MAINFTVSTFTFTEDPSASIMGQNMISGGSFTITPNEGFTVSASDFSAPGTLPGQFDSITFTDTAVAGEINNTVTVSFVFSILFEMSAELNTINVPFTGHARPVDNKRYIDFRIAFIDDTSVNLNGSSAVSSFGSTVTQSGPTPEPTVITNLSASNVTAGFLVQIGTLVVTADDSPEICNFINPPTIELVNMPNGTVSLQLDSITRRDGETDTVKEWNYKIMFVSEFSLTSNAQVIISYTGIVKKTAKEIKQIIVGGTEVAFIGGNKNIKVVGDVGAKFDLTLIKNSNSTSIIDTNLANADILDRNAGVIRGVNKTLEGAKTKSAYGTFEFTQNFPTISSNESYNLNIYPGENTTLNSSITQPPSSQVVFNQYIRPTITINTDDDGGPNTYDVTSQTTISLKGHANKTPSQLRHMKKIVDKISFTYVYTVTNTSGTTFSTANVPTWSMTDANSNWDQSVTNHGNIIEIVNIAIALSGTPSNTIATVTGDVIIRKFGTADVTFTLDSSDFLTVT
tara:strand:+ start:5909 stop:7450 length:1542 start_codon:yes stop_codon:yes gene_type:complete